MSGPCVYLLRKTTFQSGDTRCAVHLYETGSVSERNYQSHDQWNIQHPGLRNRSRTWTRHHCGLGWTKGSASVLWT